MVKVGLTGGIGSGKTLVSRVFSCLEIPVFNADLQARFLMENDAGLVNQIRAYFGNQSFLADGKLNRSFLATEVFSSTDKLKVLNEMVHPKVRSYFRTWAREQKSPYVVQEAAILFESGANKDMCTTIMVTAPVETRIERVIKRDGISREQVLERMKNQMSDEDKIKLADHVIINDGMQALLPQILKLHDIFTF